MNDDFYRPRLRVTPAYVERMRLAIARRVYDRTKKKLDESRREGE